MEIITVYQHYPKLIHVKTLHKIQSCESASYYDYSFHSCRGNILWQPSHILSMIPAYAFTYSKYKNDYPTAWFKTLLPHKSPAANGLQTAHDTCGFIIGSLEFLIVEDSVKQGLHSL